MIAGSVTKEIISHSGPEGGSASADLTASYDSRRDQSMTGGPDEYSASADRRNSIDDSGEGEVQINCFEDILYCQKLIANRQIERGVQLLTAEFFPRHTYDLFADFPDDPELADIFINYLADEELLKHVTIHDLTNSCDALLRQFAAKFRFIYHLLENLNETAFLCLAPDIPCEDICLVPANFVKRYPKDFVYGINLVSIYSPEQISIVTNAVAACLILDPTYLHYMGRREQWEAINPLCVGYMPTLSEVDLDQLLQNDVIPGNMFSYYSGEFSDATLTALTAKHLRYYGTESNKQLSTLNLNLISPNAAPGVSSEMFKKFILSRKEPVILKGMWRKFSESIFSSFAHAHEVRKLAANISGEAYKELTKAQVSFILKFPEACGGIPEDADISKARLESIGLLSSKCFAAMNPKIQMKIISSGAALPDNILEYIGSQELLKMDYSIYSLNKLKGRNVKKMIENLSSKIEEKQLHACRLIKEPEVLRRMRIFKKTMPKNCWKFMTMKIKAKNVLKNPTLFAGRPKVLKTLLENEKGYTSNINLVGKRGIQKLTAGRAGRECRFMSLSVFARMSGEFRSGLSPTCICNLPFLSQLDAEEMLHFVPDGFAHVDNKQARDLHYENLTNRHLEHLSEAVNFTRTAGSSMTRNILVNQIKPCRLSHLPARVWGTIPPSAFAVFSDPSILSRIPGEKMAYWTKEQVSMIPKDTLASLDKEQATLIGTLSGEKSSLVKYLVGIIPRKNMPANVVLGERIHGQSNSASSSIRSITCTAVLAALMTVALLL